MSKEDVKIRIAKIFSILLIAISCLFFIPLGIGTMFSSCHTSYPSGIQISGGIAVTLFSFAYLLYPKQRLVFGTLIMIFSIFVTSSLFGGGLSPYWMILPIVLYPGLGTGIAILTIASENVREIREK